MATFADVVRKQKKEGAGGLKSFVSALGQKSLEKIDPRNYLFKRTGALASAFPGLKGYQAQGTKQSSTLKTGVLGDQAGLMTQRLENIEKNTASLPLIAKEINIMRTNLGKLLKSSDISPTRKASSFFEQALAKETAIEKMRQENQRKEETKPTPTRSSPKPFLTGKGLLGLLVKGGLVVGLIAGLREYFQNPEFKESVKGWSNAIFNTLGESILGAEYWNELKIRIKEGLDSTLEIFNSKVLIAAGILGSLAVLSGPLLLLKSTIGLLTKAFGAVVGVLGKIPGVGKVIGGAALGGTAAVAGGVLIPNELGNSEDPDFLKKLQENSPESITTTNSSTSSTPTQLKNDQTEMASLIYERFKQAGFTDIQAQAALANAIRESGLNPNAVNSTSKEESVGLFQLNRKGGLGEGRSVEELKDPEKNIAITIEAAKNSTNFKNATTLQQAISAFVKDVERPSNQSSEIEKRMKIASDMSNQFETLAENIDQSPNIESIMNQSMGKMQEFMDGVFSTNERGEIVLKGSDEMNEAMRGLMDRGVEMSDQIINNINSTNIAGGGGNKNSASVYDEDFIARHLMSRQTISI